MARFFKDTLFLTKRQLAHKARINIGAIAGRSKEPGINSAQQSNTAWNEVMKFSEALEWL